MTPRTVNVTAAHIAAATPGNCEHCAVAMAARRAFAGPIKVRYRCSIGGRQTYFIETGEGDFFLPRDAVAFIHDFDKRLPVRPVSFVVSERIPA